MKASKNFFHPCPPPIASAKQYLPQSPGLTLGFEKAEDVVNLDCCREESTVSTPFLDDLACMERWISHTGTLDVADDGARSVVHEFDADLGNTTAGA